MEEYKCGIQGGPKNGLLLRVDNFAVVYGKEAYIEPENFQFCLEKEYLHVSAFKYSLPSLQHVKLC